MIKTFFNGARGPNQPPHRRSTPQYPSYDNGAGCTPRQTSPEYTGTYVIGIGSMHKSNDIPVTDPQQAKDISNMRRVK